MKNSHTKILVDDPLEKAKAILDNLELTLINKKECWLGVRRNNPDFESLSDENWRERSSRSWLHGATEIFESNELEKWDRQPVKLSELAHAEAHPLIRSWKKQNNEKDPWGTYYSDDPRFTLKALPGETLFEFIIRMARNTEEKGKGHRLAWRALNSFLYFLLETKEQVQVAFIEHIFPKKRDIKHGRIIRKIPPEVYPIPVQNAGDLIIMLAKAFRESRRDAQLGVAETLGLCWICLTASRLRLPTQVEMLINIEISAIGFQDTIPYIDIPTFFGPQRITISHRFANFFIYLSQIGSNKPRKTILQKPLRSLSRILKKTAAENERLRRLGNITFLTLISPPHIHGEDFRFIPKK